MVWSIVIVASCLGVMITGYLMNKETTSKRAEYILSVFGIISLIGCIVSLTWLSLSAAIS